MTFDQFYTDLKSDQVWFTNATMYYKPETVISVANDLFMACSADNTLNRPMGDMRRYFWNKLKKITPDKAQKKWTPKGSDLNEPEVATPALVRGSPEYLQRVDELLKAHLSRSQEPFKRIRNISDKEIKEEGQVDKKKTIELTPSQLEQRIGARKHFDLARSSRGRYFLEAYPDASANEVDAYCDKFLDIDDPLKLFH